MLYPGKELTCRNEEPVRGDGHMKRRELSQLPFIFRKKYMRFNEEDCTFFLVVDVTGV